MDYNITDLDTPTRDSILDARLGNLKRQLRLIDGCNQLRILGCDACEGGRYAVYFWGVPENYNMDAFTQHLKEVGLSHCWFIRRGTYGAKLALMVPVELPRNEYAQERDLQLGTKFGGVAIILYIIYNISKFGYGYIKSSSRELFNKVDFVFFCIFVCIILIKIFTR